MSFPSHIFITGLHRQGSANLSVDTVGSSLLLGGSLNGLDLSEEDLDGESVASVDEVGLETVEGHQTLQGYQESLLLEEKSGSTPYNLRPAR